MKINWLHVVNSIGGAVTVITGLNPALFGPYAPQAAMVIGGITVASNIVHAALASTSTETLPPPSSGTVVKLHWLTVVAALAMACAVVSSIQGCASTQTFLDSPTGAAAVSVGVGVAVTAAESKGVTAAQINSVAKAVLQADSGTSATLAALTNVVNSAAVKAGVPTADIIAFKYLETAFDAWLVTKYGNNTTVQNVQADVAVFCNEVIADTGG